MTSTPEAEFSSLAEADLEEIALYIARGSKRSAEAFTAAIQAKAAAAAAMPLAYPARPELGPAMRMTTHGRYVILFRPVAAGGIRIERVLHSARNFRSLF
ncbi:MAG: type II toxin-antitoxin system RelE/ParE family toxin [Rubritepida sp.]|nr:type II toxin-antitoxin system RelE/ParE family toxin [Rubritepida sp.]